MQVNALVADRYIACNLLGASLNAQIVIYIGTNLRIYTAGITA